MADLYNADRLKEFCSWFQRINPKVNDFIQTEDIEQMFTFLEYKPLREEGKSEKAQ